jgi:hypothetical protein
VLANRKQGRTVILMAGKEQGGVLDLAAIGRNRPGEALSLCLGLDCSSTVLYTTLLLSYH